MGMTVYEVSGKFDTTGGDEVPLDLHEDIIINAIKAIVIFLIFIAPLHT